MAAVGIIAQVGHGVEARTQATTRSAKAHLSINVSAQITLCIVADTGIYEDNESPVCPNLGLTEQE
jgi:hypothetical protein